MRVVLISFSTLPTMQKYLYLAHEELVRRGVSAFTVGSESMAITHPLTASNICIPTPDTPRPTPRSLVVAHSVMHALSSRIAALQPDIVHFVNKHVWNYPLLRRLRRVLPHTQFLHTFHDPIGHEGDAVQKGVVLYHRLIQARLDGIIVHSEVSEQQTRSALKPGCPVFRVPLGVTRWREYTEHSTTPPGRALIFGRLNRYKGCEHYPEILARAYAIDPALQVTIAGKPAPDLPAPLLEAIRQQPNVRLLDRYIEESEVDGLFADTDLVLMPYTSITQSGVILDAYSRSLPILAFDIRGMRPFVPTGQPLIDPYDLQSFAETMVDLLGEPSRLQHMGRQAWDFGRNQFTPSVMTDGLLAAYTMVTP